MFHKGSLRLSTLVTGSVSRDITTSGVDDEGERKMKEMRAHLLKEKNWILGTDSKPFDKRKSSQGCDLKVLVHGEKITCGTFVIPPGKRLGRISAHSSDETYYVVRGILKVELPRLGETMIVKKGEIFYMPGGMIHAPFNDGEDDCEVLWHCAPDWP
jgi:mannose-6-phosphate isomerase-like protein (cupin superfamily)